MQPHKVAAYANRGHPMEHPKDIRHRILDIVHRLPDCEFEGIMRECADPTWNQVFLEVDHLSRWGLVVLKQQRPGHSSVTAKGSTPTIH